MSDRSAIVIALAIAFAGISIAVAYVSAAPRFVVTPPTASGAIHIVDQRTGEVRICNPQCGWVPN
jgi:hypothetical protein